VSSAALVFNLGKSFLRGCGEMKMKVLAGKKGELKCEERKEPDLLLICKVESDFFGVRFDFLRKIYLLFRNESPPE